MFTANSVSKFGPAQGCRPTRSYLRMQRPTERKRDGGDPMVSTGDASSSSEIWCPKLNTVSKKMLTIWTDQLATKFITNIYIYMSHIHMKNAMPRELKFDFEYIITNKIHKFLD